MFDLMLVSHSRTTRVTHLYSNKKGSVWQGTNAATSQRYNQGNVAIMPQDIATLRPLLPPGREEIKEAMCALFVGASTVPTEDTIHKLSPVLVTKSRVITMLDFLLTSNTLYKRAATFSQSNLDDLFSFANRKRDTSFPHAAELACLPLSDVNPVATSSYTSRSDRTGDDDPEDDNELGKIVMEAVGYAAGERTPESYSVMKATALAWCLDCNKFIQMQTGSTFISENDFGMITFAFPHLDPISFERYVKNLLMQHHGRFQNDLNFAYVCWNIMQKKEKWEAEPNAKPSTKQEKRAMRVLKKLKLIAKDLKGSSGYKQCRRNEIRALIRQMSTPALFVTLNPADIVDPLLGAMGDLDFDTWSSMSRFERSRYVARNPAVAALYFDRVINAFVHRILKYSSTVSEWFVRSLHGVLWHGGGPRAGNSSLSYADLDSW
ncbi:hypothetical protein DFH06DRAFT_1274602 [Mycena polygramma]|nr:hypothetical protein DFH06DRAFT_1274602 [Mycena polygramma]